MDRQRSSRGCCVSNIALDIKNESETEIFNCRLLPDPEQCNASRLCLTTETNQSSRNSLVPEKYTTNRSSRGSLVPDSNRSRCNLMPEVSRNPRESLVSDSLLNFRNSLAPLDIVSYNRSPRGNFGPGVSGSSISLMPENGMIKSLRHSLVPDLSRSPRGSITNIEFDVSPRGSIYPEVRSLRKSIMPLDIYGEKKDRIPRESIASECINQSLRGSIVPENRLLRGSICPEGSNRSPRGSIALHEPLGNKSSRGSIGMGEIERSNHRGFLGGLNSEDDSPNKSPCGNIGPMSEFVRSPRGSLGGLVQERSLPKTGFTMQEFRRSSADQVSPRSYRHRGEISGRVRSGGSGGAQVNHGYGATNSWLDLRRASSSVSQFSVDESRRLYSGNASIAEKGSTVSGVPMGVVAYGSLVFQLKDAYFEANGTCDFIFRSLKIISKTMVVTIFLAFLSTMPIVMLILGVQFIRDCPREPHIPVYMVVGGTLGGVRMFWTLYSQIRSRRPEVLTVPGSKSYISPKKLVSIALSCFLVGWFALGNYWIFSIRWPDYNPTLFEPNLWCHKTLYVFSLVHLIIVYLVMFVGVLTSVSLLFCRVLACPWPERYK